MTKLDGKVADNILWSEFLKGNHKAFSVIYSQYFSVLYNYGKKFTQQNTILEESAQELFVELWHSRSRLSSINVIRPYLYKSFRRKLLRKLKNQSSTSILEITNLHFATESSYEEDIAEVEKSHRQSLLLQEALKDLSNRQREAIFLKFYDKLSYAEISEVMDCEVKVAYDLVFKAIKKMRKRMPKKEFVFISIAILIYYFFAHLI